MHQSWRSASQPLTCSRTDATRCPSAFTHRSMTANTSGLRRFTYAWSDERTTGGVRQMAQYGLFSSRGSYVVPQLSQTSPYWSGVPHFGQVPFTKRSGRKRRSTSQ